MASAIGAYVCEGTSDDGLASLVEALFAQRGVRVRLPVLDSSRVPPGRRTVQGKVEHALVAAGGHLDVVAVHRDADRAGYASRRREIERAAAGLGIVVVPVIPMRMTEAWLLLDEAAIRRAAGNPHGVAELGLPRPRDVERHPDPKAILRGALLAASELSGRRRKAAAAQFSDQRRLLLEELDPFGAVTQLEGWRLLEGAVGDAVQQLP